MKVNKTFAILGLLILSLLVTSQTSKSSHEGSIITIDGNAALALYAKSGSGISGDPYLLNETKFIDDSYTGEFDYHYLISITNTDTYFVLENIYSSYYSFVDNVTRIDFQDVSNAVIRNVTIVFADIGISVLRGDNINITNVNIYAYDIGIELGAVTNSHITNNRIKSFNPIYFSYVERDYSYINSGSMVPSNNITFKDNTFVWGGINGLFPIKYAFNDFISHTYTNNSIADETTTGDLVNQSPILFIFNQGLVEIKDQYVGQLTIINASQVILENLTYRGDILIENVNSININNIHPHKTYSVGYMAQSFVFNGSDSLEITNSTFGSVDKFIPSSRDHYNSSLVAYEKFLVEYIVLSNIGSLQFKRNVIDVRHTYTSMIMKLQNSNNSLIENNDFLSIDNSTNSLVYDINSYNSTVRYNNFLANPVLGYGWSLYPVEESNLVFDKNYYQGNPNRTDSNNDGIFDTPFELNDYVKAWSGVLVVDNHPLANPHGILNFTFPDIDAILTGIVRLNWTAHDLREIYNITYSLFRLNGAEWNHINDVYQVQQMDFNTTMLADGVYTFKLTAISYSARANRTQTIEIQFSLSIYNEGDPPVTTTIPVETTSTSLDNTVTTTVTETTTEVSIETTTRTESEVNAPFMIFIALLLPLAAKFTIHYKK